MKNPLAAQTEDKNFVVYGGTPLVPGEIVALCRGEAMSTTNSEDLRRVSGIYCFRPLGVELRNNIRRFWWSMVQLNDNVPS